MNLKGTYRSECSAGADEADEADAAVAALTDAQRQTAEHRLAAEKLAADVRELEESLAAEAEKARHAADFAQAVRLQQAAEQARAREAEAAERAAASAADYEREVSARAAAGARKRACDAAQERAMAQAATAGALLADARRTLRDAKAALAADPERESRAISEEGAARLKAAESAQLLNERRAARASLEEELRASQERLKAFENRAAEPAADGGAAKSLTAGAALVGAGLALLGVVALLHSFFWTAGVPRSQAKVAAPTAARAWQAVPLPHHARPQHPAGKKPRDARVAALPHHRSPAPRSRQAVPPSIVLLSMLPRRVLAGTAATLCVSAAHAQKLFVTGLGTFNPRLTTCRTVLPKRTTSFVAYAANTRGQRAKRKITVVVERTALAWGPYGGRSLHARGALHGRAALQPGRSRRGNDRVAKSAARKR